MGGSESTNSNPFYESNKECGLEKYNFVTSYDDKFLGRCSILENKETKEMLISKNLLFSNEEEQSSRFKELTHMKETLKSDNVLRIKDIISSESVGLFFKASQITLISEYPLTNLEKELSQRRLLNRPFSKSEMLEIITSSVGGCAELERNGYENTKLRLKHIFVGLHSSLKEYESKGWEELESSCVKVIKVIAPSLLPEPSNEEYIRTCGFGQLPVDLCPAPEQIRDPTLPASKAPIFSLGASLLACCLLKHPQDIYFNGQVNYREVTNRIQIASNRFGPFIAPLLHSMLAQEDTRPSFAELEFKIAHLEKSSLPTMRYSTIKGNEGFRVSLENEMNSQNVRMEHSQRMFSSVRSEDVQEVKSEVYTNGNSYVGEKRGGKKHGIGKYCFRDGSVYEGEWRNGVMSGKGEFYSNFELFKQGTFDYSGEWFNGEYNGWGTQINRKNKGGNVKENEVNWIKYEGDFKNGKREGTGRMTFANGIIFNGEFQNDFIHGNGNRIENGKIVEKFYNFVMPDKFLSFK